MGRAAFTRGREHIRSYELQTVCQRTEIAVRQTSKKYCITIFDFWVKELNEQNVENVTNRNFASRCLDKDGGKEAGILKFKSLIVLALSASGKW